MSVRYATVSAMRAAATSGFNTNVANTCYVDALGDFFNFKAGSTTPDVSNVVVSSSDALGKWHRMGIPPQVAASSVLLYDASGNAVATANSGSTAGRIGLPVLIGEQVLTGVTTYTPPVWAANAYREIKLTFNGRAVNSPTTYFIQLQGDTTAANYGSFGILHTSGVVVDGSYPAGSFAGGLLGDGVNGASIWIEAVLKPLKNGNNRMIRSSTSYNQTGAAALNGRRDLDVTWYDTTTDITTLRMFTSGGAQTFEGRVEVWGLPA